METPLHSFSCAVYSCSGRLVGRCLGTEWFLCSFVSSGRTWQDYTSDWATTVCWLARQAGVPSAAGRWRGGCGCSRCNQQYISRHSLLGRQNKTAAVETFLPAKLSASLQTALLPVNLGGVLSVLAELRVAQQPEYLHGNQTRR